MAQFSVNFRYLLTPVGILKLLITLFVVISLSLGAHAFEQSLYNVYIRYWNAVNSDFLDRVQIPGLGRERCFIIFAAIALVTIVYSLFSRVFGEKAEADPPSKVFSIVFHVFEAVLLIAAGALLIDSARQITSKGCPEIPKQDSDFKCQYRAEKDFGGVFAFAAAALHLAIVMLHVLPGRFGSAA